MFSEWGGHGFHWTNFTTSTYENGYLRFRYNYEGDIIRVTVSINYSREVFILGRPFNELNHATVTHLLGQAGIEIFHATENFIGSFKLDSAGGELNIFFYFDDESNITWFDMYYENPWEERR